MSTVAQQRAVLSGLVGRSITEIVWAESGFGDVGRAVKGFILDDGTRIVLTGSDDNQAYIHTIVAPNGVDVRMCRLIAKTEEVG